MKNPTIQPDKIHLQQIQLLSADFYTSEAYRDHPHRPKEVKFGFAHSIANNFEHNRTRIRLAITIQSVDEHGSDQGLHCKYELEFHFKVDNFQDFIRKGEDDEIQIDALIGATLLSIAVSSARGIIYERTRGTYFEGVILPIVDPNVLLKS